MLAEWDTVSAIGLPLKLRKKKLAFVNDEVPSHVENAFLAVPMHEKRGIFRPMVWKAVANDDTKMRQCAFVGCHSE